jgi:hypothetical protein
MIIAPAVGQDRHDAEYGHDGDEHPWVSRADLEHQRAKCAWCEPCTARAEAGA